MTTTSTTGFFSVPSSSTAASTTGFTFGVAPATAVTTTIMTATVLPSLQQQQQQQKSTESVVAASSAAATTNTVSLGSSAFNMGGASMFSMPASSATTATASASASPFSITPMTSATQFAITTVSSFPTTLSFSTVTATATTTTTSTPSLFSSVIVSAPPASLSLTTTTTLPLTTPVSSMTFVTSTATVPTAATMPSTMFSIPTITSTATTTTTASLSLFPAVSKISRITSTPGLTFSGITSTSAAIPQTTVASLTTATTVTSSTVTQTPVMNFRQLEEAINKWNLELEEQERIFLNQATEVNAWDCLLISNGEKITSLYEAVEYVKVNQQRLDHELDFIVAQQRELEEILTPLEKSVEGLPNLSVQQHADLEREHTYHLAESIDTQLKRMAEDIKEIIEHINSRNNNKDENDPIHQIAKILNSHMDALQWIEQNTVVVQRKLEDVSKMIEVKKSDKDKSIIAGYRK
ncbi:nuclear pore glycoprotein p62-like [Centruroides sculpturatus]|uniref:nuclear pore glycoprotein p62-like n=1 Tax=Centruroides sculpturatus TaxID=218467 RepID=UPI000C6D7411|nr:nuclear pore glycoprotein p62-like [Centruroides sculpturatus]